MLSKWAVIDGSGLISSPLPVSAVPDLVGWYEEEHRDLEAPAHVLLPHPLLHQPHHLQVKFLFLFFSALGIQKIKGL